MPGRSKVLRYLCVHIKTLTFLGTLSQFPPYPSKSVHYKPAVILKRSFFIHQEEEVANILRVLYHVVLLPLMQTDSLPPQFEDLGGPIDPSRISLLRRGGDMIVECTRKRNRLSGENTYLVLPTATTECPDQRLFLLPSSPHPQRETKINNISSCSIVLIRTSSEW